MALKKEPSDTDNEPFFGTNSCSPAESSPATSTMSTPLPAHFLGEQGGGCDMILDPLQEEVVFLPHRAPRGRTHHHRMQGVTEYANYTISHLEAEVNSKHLPKKYRCRFCIYKTSYKSDLNRHLKKHGIALQHCPLCNMPFKTAGNLENHIGQVHSNVVRNMSNVSLLSKDAFVSPGRMETSPTMSNLHSGDNDAPLSVDDSDHDQQSVQYEKDFPTLSNALHSPHQLHCHMCPFVSNDAQVLARHILTHPGEEEASRTSQATEEKLPIPRLICSVCGVNLSSADELLEHRHSCVDSEKSDPYKNRKSVWSRENMESAKQSSRGEKGAGCRLGLPRQETMDKLKRALTHQSIRSDGRTCPTTQQTFPNRTDKTSMILPHIPAAETLPAAADHSHRESVSDHQASNPSPAVEIANEETYITCSAVDSSVWSRLLNSQTRKPDRTVGQQVSSEVYHLTSASAEQEQTQPSSEDPSPTTETSCLSEYRSQKRQQRSALSLQYVQPEKTFRPTHVPFVEKDTVNQKEADHDEKMSNKQLPVCVDSQTACFKSSEKGETHDLFAYNTISIKEEPLSPDHEESENTCETDSKSSSGTVRPNLTTDSPWFDTREIDCDFCGQLFKDRTQLTKHVHHVHVLPTEQTRSSVKTDRIGSRQHHKMMTTQRMVRFPEDGCKLSKRQKRFHSGGTVCLNNRTARKSTHRQIFPHRVVPEPPSSGRCAMLVSDFDEFASKPYACSLCFFRTGHLTELSAHVHNHLTGGSTAPLPAGAGFRSVEPFLVERGTSPFKVDSENGESFVSMTVPEETISSAVSANCGVITTPRTSCEENTRVQYSAAGWLDSIGGSSEEADQRHRGDVNSLSPVAGTVRNSVTISSHVNTTGSGTSTKESIPQTDSLQTSDGISLDSSRAEGVLNKDCVSSCLGQRRSIHDSKQSNKFIHSEKESLSDKTLPENQKLDSSRTSPNIAHHDDSQCAHHIQKPVTLTNVTQDNILVAPGPNLSSKSRKRFTLKQKNQSSRMSPKKKPHLRVSEKKQETTKFKSKYNVQKKASMIKKSVQRTAVSARSYECDQCKHSFSLRPLLFRHMRYIHLVSTK